MDKSHSIMTRLKGLATKACLPGIEETTYYGRPALKAGGKAFVWVKDDETIVLAVPVDAKEPLLMLAPEIYWETDHYRGWPALPLRAAAIGDEELSMRLVEAWRFRAPKKLAAAFDNAG